MTLWVLKSDLVEVFIGYNSFDVFPEVFQIGILKYAYWDEKPA